MGRQEAGGGGGGLPQEERISSLTSYWLYFRARGGGAPFEGEGRVGDVWAGESVASGATQGRADRADLRSFSSALEAKRMVDRDGAHGELPAASERRRELEQGDAVRPPRDGDNFRRQRAGTSGNAGPTRPLARRGPTEPPKMASAGQSFVQVRSTKVRFEGWPSVAAAPACGFAPSAWS
jgi:hypothetical protein